jgi:hypothetical protein
MRSTDRSSVIVDHPWNFLIDDYISGNNKFTIQGYPDFISLGSSLKATEYTIE